MNFTDVFSTVRLFSIGLVIGMANVIPGVSGGTLAVVFNIYDQFINAITFNLKRIWSNRRFVFPLLSGMAMGVLAFSKLITVLYGNFPVQTDCAFVGLIIGSIPLIGGYALKKPENGNLSTSKTAGLALCFVAGCALIIFFGFLEGAVDRTEVRNFVLPAIELKLELRIFIAGFIGAVAMVIPGISGSLLMLIMGVYMIIMTCIPLLVKTVLSGDFVGALHPLFLLLPNGIGVLMGLLCGAKFIGYVLKKAPNHAYAVILGLLAGSAWNIFPPLGAFNSPLRVVASFVCMAGGVCLAYFTSKSPSEE